MKKLNLFLSCMMIASLAMPAKATEPTKEYAPGVTVEKNTNTDWATDYTATFVYEDKDEKDATKVEVYGSFQYYKPEECEDFKAFDPVKGVVPHYRAEDWEEGMFFATSDSETYVMDEVKEETFQVTIPVSANQHFYAYKVTYADNTVVEKVLDPENLPFANEDGCDSGWSLFYVGTAVDCVTGQEYVYPREDGKTGNVEYITYTAVDGSTQYVGVYTPYGYDTSKTYKTVYVSHGGGGNEVEWFNIGAAGNIMDNLLAEGLVEPAVIVTMNNTVFNWDYSKVLPNILGNIIPTIEGKYAVSKSAEDRSFCGLSMGSMTTNEMARNHPGEFAHFGAFSGGAQGLETEKFDVEGMKGTDLYFTAGCIDMAYNNPMGIATTDYLAKLDELGISYEFDLLNGSHDWGVWRESLTRFLRDYALVKEEVVVPEDKPTEEKPTVNTGDTAPIAIVGVAMLAAAAAFVELKRRAK